MNAVTRIVRGLRRNAQAPARRGTSLRAELALADREAARTQRIQPYVFSGWINR